MSGSGIVDLKDRNDALLGSAFIAGTVAHEPFEKMYFVESDSDRAATLRERLDYAADEIDEFTQPREDCIVITGDANDVLPTIPRRIRKHRGGSATGQDGEGGQHHLAFIDNERDEIKFDAIRRLRSGPQGDLWGDLLVNYQENGLNREKGRIESGLTDNWDDFIEFFDGDQSVRYTDSPDERFQLYLEKLHNIGLSEHESVQIRGSESHPYGYRMVYATRTTGGGSEYAEFMSGQRKKIEGLTGDDIETVLDTMKGAATHLGLWSLDEDEQGQSRLGSF